MLISGYLLGEEDDGSDLAKEPKDAMEAKRDFWSIFWKPHAQTTREISFSEKISTDAFNRIRIRSTRVGGTTPKVSVFGLPMLYHVSTKNSKNVHRYTNFRLAIDVFAIQGLCG